MGFMKQTKHIFDQNFDGLNTTMGPMLVAVLSGFIGGNISSCKLQDIINRKQYINYIILFLMIFVLQGWNSSLPMHPLHKVMLSVLLMLYFTVIMRNNYIAIIVGGVLLLLSNEMKEYKKYLADNVLETDAKKLKDIEDRQKMLELVGLIVIGLGFVINIVMKMKGGNFNVIRHLFGKCN